MSEASFDFESADSEAMSVDVPNYLDTDARDRRNELHYDSDAGPGLGLGILIDERWAWNVLVNESSISNGLIFYSTTRAAGSTLIHTLSLHTFHDRVMNGSCFSLLRPASRLTFGFDSAVFMSIKSRYCLRGVCISMKCADSPPLRSSSSPMSSWK